MEQEKQNEFDLWSAPTTLEGRQLRLEPLSLVHLDQLAKQLLTKNAWPYKYWQVRTPKDLENQIVKLREATDNKSCNAFAMVVKETGQAVGQSRFMSFNQGHRYLEIGGTWIGDQWQKTFVNTEAKLLMLTQVFETLKCQRVEFRVDSLNFNSQRAVLRLGAKFEGELRNSCLLPDGIKRDYRVYSVIESEWPNVKRTLTGYLNHYV